MNYPIGGQSQTGETLKTMDTILQELSLILGTTEIHNSRLTSITVRLLGPQPTTAETESVEKVSDSVIDLINYHLQKIKSQHRITQDEITRLEGL